jgi:hypothetical protein
MNNPYDDDDNYDAMKDSWLTDGIPYNDRTRQEVQDERDAEKYGWN